MAVITGIAITKTNSYIWMIRAGWTIATLGLGILILMDVGTSIPKFIFLNLVPGIGIGILFPALQFQLQAASTNEDMAWTVAMFTFFRSFGQALGVAIGMFKLSPNMNRTGSSGPKSERHHPYLVLEPRPYPSPTTRKNSFLPPHLP